MKTISAKELVKMLTDAKAAYYAGNPVMTDSAFDAIEEDLRKIDPKNPYFNVVGAPINAKLKYKHLIPMLSAGKAKTFEEVEAWAKKMDISPNEMLLIEPKIDGCSGSIIYENGKIKTIATRGDGEIGQDITHVAAYMDIPKTIDIKNQRVEVRGEFYLPKNNALIKENLRNGVVGLINRKDNGLMELKHAHFVTYQVLYDNFKSEGYKMSWLQNNGFEVIEHSLMKLDAVSDFYDNYLKTLRSKWQYETDGLILVTNDNTKWQDINDKYTVDHHNHYMIALKPPSEGKATQLTGIEWNVSRQGKLIPVGLFKPIVLGGATVKRATLNNFDNVKALGLFEGDDVFITRANDVIPFFQENLSAKIKGHPKGYDKSIVPSRCPSCNGKLVEDGVHLVCKNNNCPEKMIMRVVHWVKACEMEFFSESSVRALFEAGKISTIHDLYQLTYPDFNRLDGFGESRIKNTLKQIENTKEMTIAQFIDRLGIDMVGEKAVANMGIKTVADMWAFNNPQDLAVGRFTIAYLKENKDFVKDLLSAVIIKAPKAVAVGARKVAMTGSGPDKRDVLAKRIEASGDVFVDSVGKDTNILLCEDVNGSSSKLAKATKLGVKLMAYDEYFK